MTIPQLLASIAIVYLFAVGMVTVMEWTEKEKRSVRLPEKSAVDEQG